MNQVAMAARQLVLAAETEASETRQNLHRGILERVRRGAYAPVVEATDVVAAQLRACRKIAAVARQLTLPMCISHLSAALVWGLPMLHIPRHTHITQPSKQSVGRGDPDLRRHSAFVEVGDRTILDGVPTTSLERTVLDCARSLWLPEAVAVTDGALNLGLDLDLVQDRLTDMHGWRGVRRARSVLNLARVGAESARESQTRVLLVTNGIAEPILQHEVRTPSGRFRLDMAWPELMVGLEYDGAVKYAELANGNPVDVVLWEKERENALRRLGWTIIRVTYRDLKDTVALIGLVQRTLAAATRRPLPTLR
ncbi:MAG: hypothetical protein ACK5H2_12030 [Beutenbergiaceae bacterium]